jgi:hypothetical protein
MQRLEFIIVYYRAYAFSFMNIIGGGAEAPPPGVVLLTCSLLLGKNTYCLDRKLVISGFSTGAGS